MKESESLQLKLSELRGKINSFGTGDDETEYRAEEYDALTNEYQTLEAKYRMAVIKESAEIEATPTEDLDSEKRESRAMEYDLEVRNYVASAMMDAPLEGREREYNDSLKLEGVGTLLPWMALLSPEDRRELRAATTAPSDSDTAVHGILQRVFAHSAADYLGVSSLLVPVGAANYPVLSGGVVPANADGGAAADETAATLTANVLDPVRLTASYRMRREDLAKLRMMEDSLRMDLQGAIMESRDKSVIAGDADTEPNPDGFLNALTDVTNPTLEAIFADYASAKASLVDGKYAMSADDVRIVCGKQTYQHASKIYQTGSGTSALEKFAPRVSAHIPDASNGDIQKAIASRSMGRAVCPMWPAVELIRDIYTGASKGEVVLTMCVLWNFKILDEAGYQLLEFKLA